MTEAQVQALEKKKNEARLTLRILTDRGTEYCGSLQTHDYELFLGIVGIERTKPRLGIRKQQNMRALPQDGPQRALPSRFQEKNLCLTGRILRRSGWLNRLLQRRTDTLRKIYCWRTNLNYVRRLTHVGGNGRRFALNPTGMHSVQRATVRSSKNYYKLL